MCIAQICYKKDLSLACFLFLSSVKTRRGYHNYNFLDFPQDTEFITSSPYLEIMLSPPPPPWNPHAFMSGSQAQNRKRNNTSSRLQTTALLQTSAPVSISRNPDCVPYWNDQVADWSKKLLLPTETGCVSSLMAQRSWFSQKITQQTNGNYLRISSPSLRSSFADYKESVPPATDSNGNAAKNKKREKKVQTTR